jgi:hypothetical protein
VLVKGKEREKIFHLQRIKSLTLSLLVMTTSFW